jgi:outer membrane protein OmpA-like peptidoglycan-associated protein
MKKLICSIFVLMAGFAPVIAQEDGAGCKDPALFTRMPGYHIYRCEDLQFDKFEFKISDNKTQIVEGHSLFIMYDLNENVQAPSPLQTVRNYTNAAKKIGWQVVYEWDDAGPNAVFKVVKNGVEAWAAIYASYNGSYNIHVIEKEAMKQDVVADASSMASSINETGKVAVYGIYFDTGKATLKPESQPTMLEIAKLLKTNPGLKLYVVGHTDNTGAFDANMKLSMDRAAAVVNALVSKQSVNAASLKACGDGPTSPVATNDTEEGKALNRRVELVKQ